MTALLSASLFVIAPLLAALLPYLLGRYGLAKRLRLADRLTLPPLLRPSRSGYAPLPGRFDRPDVEVDPKRFTVKHAAQGAVMLGAQIATMAMFISSSTSPSLAVVLLASLGGFAAGALTLAGIRYVKNAARALRPIQVLEQFGLAGVHAHPKLDSVRASLLTSIRRGGAVDVVCSDGVEVLAALSHNARPALEAPHTDLKGAKIRLFLVPPRSGTIDLETRGRTTAEIAIARLGMSPEEHWRLLNTTLQVRDRWASEYGSTIEIRYLEARPAFRMIHAGSRFFFQPWETRTAWLETRPSKSAGFNRSLRQLLIEAATSSEPNMRESAAAGPTKTTFIRKGVEVPAQRDVSHLEVEDCTEEETQYA